MITASFPAACTSFMYDGSAVLDFIPCVSNA